MSPLSQNQREQATFAIRLSAYLATLAIIGLFFVPWARIDGMGQTSSGADLIVLVVSPAFDYLVEISVLQTVVLLGSPALMIASAIFVSIKYARRETAPLATCLVFASSITVLYGAPDLTVNNGLGTTVGLTLTVVLSGLLLIHQVLIKIRGDLYRRRRLPTVYEVLSVITGSGYYRWCEG